MTCPCCHCLGGTESKRRKNLAPDNLQPQSIPDLPLIPQTQRVKNSGHGPLVMWVTHYKDPLSSPLGVHRELGWVGGAGKGVSLDFGCAERHWLLDRWTPWAGRPEPDHWKWGCQGTALGGKMRPGLQPSPKKHTHNPGADMRALGMSRSQGPLGQAVRPLPPFLR